MTQTERFLQFLKAQAERKSRDSETLMRIENDELVITHRYVVRALGCLRDLSDKAVSDGHIRD